MEHKYTNRLIHENSPYLLQHAHNPVDWYPWGDEALQKAQEEDKIILVSIGYAACHWCHVMERESFENESVAQFMNENFVNIKIDREERPDIDHIYMDAVQAITGSGGWPLNVFLLPDRRPFYGGTYFPPARAYNRSSWREVLEAIVLSWKERRNEIEEQAGNLLQHLQQSNQFGHINQATTQSVFTKENCTLITTNILKQADTVWGGFGRAPKFPQTFTIQYLLQYHFYFDDAEALKQALLSLDKMMEGGIYDHAGGGFARYSTDTEWLVPHFEKMLYDNALLLSVLCDVYQLTGEKKYETVIRKTIGFLQREFKSGDGGFWSALDADSEGEEGKFYVWSKAEVDQILGPESKLFCEYYDITEKGNWDGQNILRTLKASKQFAEERNIAEAEFLIGMDRCLEVLLMERNKRIRPATDDKILLGWNALLATALAKAAGALDDENLKQEAVNLVEFILNHFLKMPDSFECFHTVKEGKGKYPAFLDDYAYLIQACLQLQELTADSRYIGLAEGFTKYAATNFSDDAETYFFFTPVGQTDVVMRKKEMYDGATPSGNSIMADNLVQLGILLDKQEWVQRVAQMTEGIGKAIVSYPTSFGVWASLLLKLTLGINEVAIVGTDYEKNKSEMLKRYFPGKIVMVSATENPKYPMLQGKNPGSDTLLYLCRQYTCNEPVSSIEELMKQVRKMNKI
ncbi:MAG: thioredoxin domain-containing protein [Bacteroidetes bacterium]|nr:thioredoxin domain-containing protein [Bacteroidota bacterium]